VAVAPFNFDMVREALSIPLEFEMELLRFLIAVSRFVMDTTLNNFDSSESTQRDSRRRFLPFFT